MPHVINSRTNPHIGRPGCWLLPQGRRPRVLLALIIWTMVPMPSSFGQINRLPATDLSDQVSAANATPGPTTIDPWSYLPGRPDSPVSSEGLLAGPWGDSFHLREELQNREATGSSVLGDFDRSDSFQPGASSVSPWTSSAVIEPPVDAVVLPPEHRNGFFQKAILDYTYLPRWNPRGMGQHDIDAKLVFAVPFPTVEWPLLLVPGYGLHLLDGPKEVEMPGQLHDAYFAFRWLPRLSERWELDFTIAPGVYSDFEQSSDRAIRTPGYAAVTWKCRPQLHCALGIGYFDRLTVDWLPVGGLIWMPSERTRFELLFPQPKLAWQVGAFGADGRLVQDWVYLSAEFGGGAWAFRRTDNSDDLVDFRDYRIYAGLERKVRGGAELRVEFGYVFGRQIQYLSGLPSAYPSDTIMLRTGARY